MCLQQQSVRSGYAPGSEKSKLAYPFFFFYLLRVGQILEGLCHKLSKQEVIKVFPCVKIVENDGQTDRQTDGQTGANLNAP